MRKIILTTTLLFSMACGANAQTKNFIDQPYIEVTANADSLVTPNQIFIKIILSEKDNRDRVSIEEQENKMVAAFQALGINTEKDLTTSDMLSNYKFYLLKQKDIIKTKEYIVIVSNAAMAGKVFIKLEDLGISNTSIDHVDHTDLENIKNACRTKAIENAKVKAIALTKPIGQSVGSAIHISDNEMNVGNQFQGRLAVQGYKTADKAIYEPPKIEFEKIKVMIAVSAKFVLK